MALAEALADGIRNTPSPHGLVVGVFGEWGSGKTTVLNFVRKRLRDDPASSKFLVVEFSPWWFSGRGHLANAFFSQVTARFQKMKALRRSAQRQVAQYGALVATLPLPGAASLGEAATKLAPTQDVVALKRSISKSLADLGDDRRLLVVIDDIDRLEPAEITELFGLIKGVADFPNTVYLVAMDHAQVLHALNGVVGERAGDYLDKIVQTSVSLPRPDIQTLATMLVEGLNKLAPDLREDLFDHDEWQSLLGEGIAPLLKTPRHTQRLLNALRISFPPVRTEVNFVDFVGLEALRVFAPDIHTRIQEHPARFGAGSGFEAVLPDFDRQTKEFHEEWIQALPKEGSPDAIQALVGHIFPAFPGRRRHLSAGDGATLTHRRARHPECFPTYFRLAAAPDLGSKAEVDALIAATEDQDSLRQAFGELLPHTRNGTEIPKVISIIDQLRQWISHKGPHEKAVLRNVLRILGELGDSSEEDERRPLEPSVHDRLTWLALDVLEALPCDERRDAILECLTDAEAVCLSVQVVAAITSPDNQMQRLSKEDVDSVRASAADQLARVGSSQPAALLAYDRGPYNLSRWVEWAGADAPVEWIKRVVLDRDQLVLLTAAFVGMRPGPTGFEYHAHVESLGASVLKLLVEGNQPLLHDEGIDSELRERLAVFVSASVTQENGKNDPPSGSE